MLEAFARGVLEGRNHWTISTVGDDGAPQATVVWADLRDGQIVFSTVAGRAKDRNLRRSGLAAFTWVDPADAFTFVSIKGRVVDRRTGAGAHADMRALIRKYTGEEGYAPKQAAEERVTYVLEPTHAWQRVRPPAAA
jgi:PPOX class probable F420-dependent enzyme